MTKEEIIQFLQEPNHVIHFDTPENYNLLPLLFPTLTIDTELSHTDSFIVQHDIVSQNAMFNLKHYCRKFVVVSNRLFDFQVTNEDVKLMVIEWRRLNLHSRLRTLQISENAHHDLVGLLKSELHLEVQMEDDEIMLLFDSVGTGAFKSVFLDRCKKHNPKPTIKAVVTFLSKCKTEQQSIFYKRAFLRLNKKLVANLIHASREYTLVRSYSEEMDFIHFHDTLFNL